VALWFDLSVATAHQSSVLPGDLRRIVRLSEVFAHGFGLAVVAMSVWLLAPKHRRRVPRLILCGVFASLSAQLAKLAVVRLRPMAYRNEDLEFVMPESIAASWTRIDEQLRAIDVGVSYFVQSFPSAHSAMATGIAVGLCWLLPSGRWMFILLAVLACYQRVQSHSHWASDVFAGAGIGVLIAGLLVQNWGLGWLLTRYENRVDTKSRLKSDKNAN
jgi:pimeloyl-ACP methyl ester carboxylesterase